MYILFDLGGTHLRIASSENLETLENFQKFYTPQNYLEGINLLVTEIQKITKGKPITAITGGLAGTLNQNKDTLIGAPNLEGYIGYSIKSDLQAQLPYPIYLENDANLGGLGEAVFGVGKNYSKVGFLTAGTGVGGSLIIDKKLTIPQEPGHKIVIDGLTLEERVSGSALERKFNQKPKEITDPHIWESVEQDLSTGIKYLIKEWNPEILILSGSISQRLNIQRITQLSETNIPILIGSLEDKSVLYGGMSLIIDLHPGTLD